MAKKNFSFSNTILLIINLIAVIALFMAYLANYLNPKVYFAVGLSGLFYPYILLINGLFVIIWFFRVRKYCLLSLIMIIVGFNSF